MLTRREPLRRRAARPKRRLSRPCAEPRCHAIHAPIVVSDTEAYCGSHGMHLADHLASVIVRARDPICAACPRRSSDAAHILGRGRMQVRWLVGETSRTPGNLIGLCRLCHGYYTLNPFLWQEFVAARWPGIWDDLVAANRFGEQRRIPVDVADVIRKLRVRAEVAA